MKRLFLLFVTSMFVLYGMTAGAQDTPRTGSENKDCSDCDTSRYGPVTVIIKDKGKHHEQVVKVNVFDDQDKKNRNVKVGWFGFDLGWNNYVDKSAYGTAEVNDFVLAKPGGPEPASGEFSLRTGKSVNVNIWPIMVNVNLVNHYLNLKTGFGIEMNNYRYSKNISYVNDLSKTYIIRDSVNFEKNKLFTEYLTIPVLLSLKTSPYHSARSFHVAVGPTFGYLIKSRTKQVSRERHKDKQKDAFNLEKFRMGLRAELGCKWINFYGAYSFTPIHQYGLKQYPFSIGISLINCY